MDLPQPKPRKLLNPPQFCCVCGKRESYDIYLWRCAKCKKTLYCSRECQKVDHIWHSALICEDSKKIMTGS